MDCFFVFFFSFLSRGDLLFGSFSPQSEDISR